MHPRNVLAIRRTLAGSTASEVITSLTHKSSNATLLDYPTGAYTGMRTFDKIGIMDFTGHTTRLATSLQQIKFSAAHIRAQAQAQTKAQAGTQGQAQAQATANHENHDNDKENDHAIAEEDPAVTAGLAQLRKEDIMKREATTLVRAGLKFYYKQLKEQDAAVAATTGETKVTVLCTWDAQIRQPTMIAHFEPLWAPKISRCKVEIHGAPRHHATAKDSQWVRDRRELEAALDKDTNEALLLDDTTQDLYEGLSSNFYAFDRKHRAVLTAPLGSVLQGTILKVVLSVCKDENIPVRYTFPNLEHIDDWEGAFISSTSRLVLPIEKLVLPDGSVKEFAESPTIELIRDRVLQECRRRVENLISEQER